MYIIRNTTKQKVLLEQERRVFRTSDLALLWEIDNRNTLLTTVKRYVRRGILYGIQKGLYSTVPINKLHIYEIGCAVCGLLSYVSSETVLQKEGIIFQNLERVTLLGKKSLEFEVAGTKYLCRYLSPKFLVNREGILDEIKYSIATADRAIADTLHLDPEYYFDNELAVEKSNWKLIAKKVGYL
ncbi:hypothetical protein AUJ94_00140 [bacterium CG2_30_40_12]|uniref:Uncharacterized protein n=1 Tax=candidate division WWE3 bacterium CG23_combo_of_CG06-09_8_20_14_all_40_14 TaxID=1975095 RepID=A0A2G9XCN3_UNCKA|nr:MAG: hypothetical protein AUJ94_00140 [bacterium CG2_30_40_12]PIP04724.1 MAG: hypothetical protein COX53_00945 [candidate division WWE3 bacterium CG23_combo_of_CG06-09_8_20_14_all_40_14]PJE51845.1 MAG: hypothetical protein COV27_01225 [candidate division WWE3 bacterium CG10_big_fil_rev_8_21_14_0_10_39_14]